MIDLTRLLAETCLLHAEWPYQVDSTNDRAMMVASMPMTTPPILIGAERQTAGRGRGINPWWGAHGSLMFSIVVDMPGFGLSPAEWPRFSLVTGLAIAETLSHFLPTAQVGLKWPNDVWLNGKKVSGILIEQCDQFPNRLVVGIGLNVNNSFIDAPDEQRQIAVSMTDVAQGTHFPRTIVLIEFLQRWRSLVGDLATGQIRLAERWSRTCVLAGHPVLLTNGNRETMGVCMGINEDGSLLLRTAFAIERHYAGTVRLLD